jgi:phage gp36-like protein
VSYATHADLVGVFGAEEILRLAERAGEVASAEEVTARALSRAGARIDPALRSAGHVPPISDPLLTAIACDLARYYLYDQAATEEVRDRHAQALRDLDLIAQRRLRLTADADNAGPLSAGSPQHVARPPVFSDEMFEDYL